MSEVFFVLKSFAVTIALIFLMQVKVGHSTVQHHLMGWLDDSVAVDGLRYVAEGAVNLGSRAYDYGSHLVGAMTSKVSKTENASRGYSFEIKRSDAYYKQKRREEAKKKASQNDEEGPIGPEID